MSTELHMLIDDLRDVMQDVVARDPVEAKRMLEELPVTHLYIDHDLGLDSNGVEYDNGYKIICWAVENDLLPPNVQIVSSNPVGRKNIEAVLAHEGYVNTGRYWVKQ